jgi:thiamine-phosphate pyrophosphorylase
VTLGRLYLVATPRPAMPDREFLDRVQAALAGGVDLLQLRAKDWEALPYMRLGAKVKKLADSAGVPFIINDRPDVALAVGADGVHLGQHDLPVEWARRILPEAIVGRSSHEAAHAESAVAERADYFAVGPVWATPTKPGREPAGLSYVREVAARNIECPWFAIGGITLDNIGEVLAAGASRVAMVRALLDAADPAEAARGFVKALKRVPVRMRETETAAVTCK